ncbi:rod shape-determining protein MreC [Kitasatospora cinereorecta]|uniref:rod shape-determining protein MreC n=1 Tax=unclassified Streptomyces TaxID=2593676 RepID=UPI00361BDC84
MRSLRDGRRHSRPVPPRSGGRAGQAHHHGATRGMAVDLGSSGTRAWVPGRGLVESAWDDAFGRPVRRGRIVDAESCGRMLGHLADTVLGPERHGSVIVLSHPVLAGPEHRNLAGELLAALGPSGAMVLSSARAAAAYAGPRDGGPLLVVDMGAELTEVTLLVDGAVADARQAETGLSDLDPGALPAELARNVLDMITAMWRQDKHGAVRGALRKGPVLTGGGALHPDVTHRIALRLGTPVRPADDPSTAVVRGAGMILNSVLRRAGTGTGSIRPGRLR